MTNVRPVWDVKEISEADFRRIVDLGCVVSVTAKVEMTSADTSREWLEASNTQGAKAVLPYTWPRVLEFTGRWSMPGLFRFNYVGQRAHQALAKIDAWELENQKDRADFERLKEKFGTP